MKLAAYIIAGLILLTSCEHDSGTTTTDLREKQETVTQHSSSIPGGRSGDIYSYRTTGWDIIVTDKTKVYRERSSCSGLEGVSPQAVRNGDVIFFKYKLEDVDYGLGTVRPRRIEAYPPDCVSALNLDISEETEETEEDCECVSCLALTCNNSCNLCSDPCNVCGGD